MKYEELPKAMQEGCYKALLGSASEKKGFPDFEAADGYCSFLFDAGYPLSPFY